MIAKAALLLEEIIVAAMFKAKQSYSVYPHTLQSSN